MSSVNPEVAPEDQVAQESGFPFPSVPDSPFPPGGGGLTVPHHVSFSQLVNYFTRVYRSSHDEALKNSFENSLATRREPIIMEALRSRQMAACQLSWHLEPEDPLDSNQAVAADGLTQAINQIPYRQQYRRQLLEALWYGRYANQCIFEWNFSKGYRRLMVRRHIPVNGDKLVFRFSGQVGILVHPTWEGATSLTDRGRAHFFTPREREALTLHMFEPEDADFFEGEMAGSIYGTGIRGRIYWFWLLRTYVLAWLMDYLERVGAGGFTVYYYEHGSDASYKEVKARAEEQFRHNTVLMPRYRDNTTGGPGIDRIEANNAGAQLLQALITGYFDDNIRLYILGQNLSSGTAPTGLGSGVADLHAGTFARRVKYDSIDLCNSESYDLVKILNKYTYAGNPSPLMVPDVDLPNADEVMESALLYYNMGGQVDADAVRAVLGLPRPGPGHAILSSANTQAQQMAAQAQAQQMLAQQQAAQGGGGEGGGQPPPESSGPSRQLSHPPLNRERLIRRLASEVYPNGDKDGALIRDIDQVLDQTQGDVILRRKQGPPMGESVKHLEAQARELLTKGE
jgi:hypothetical protein